jgi:hypothetical protein
MELCLLNDHQLARHITTTKYAVKFMGVLWYDKYLAYNLSNNTQYIYYSTSHNTGTLPQQDTGSSKGLKPYGPKYNLMHTEHILS